jgi:hypothetical protein
MSNPSDDQFDSLPVDGSFLYTTHTRLNVYFDVASDDCRSWAIILHVGIPVERRK